MDNKTINEEESMTGHEAPEHNTPNPKKPTGKKEMLAALYKRVQEEKQKIKDQQSQEQAESRKVNVKYIKPKKGNRIALSMVFTFIILGVSVVSSAAIIFLAKEVFGIDKSASSYTINVPEGASVNDVIEIMTDGQAEKNKEEIIRVPAIFKLMVKFKKADGGFIHGPHTLRPDMGYSAIIAELNSDENIRRETVDITFKEGINIYEAATILEENNVCAADKFIYYFNNGLDDYEFEKSIPKSTAVDLRFYRMEGYLFPDTYQFYEAYDILSMEPQEYEIIIRKIYDNFEAYYTKEISDKAAQKGLSMDQLITLASMIQAEAASNEDMYNVSSVFWNRLNNSDEFPRLESDPTEKYVNQVIKKLSDPLNENMVTAYNTYESAGFPPGAICSPGANAIDAALNPNQTNYLYFCANINTREVYYAETLEQHEMNLELAGITADDY